MATTQKDTAQNPELAQQEKPKASNSERFTAMVMSQYSTTGGVYEFTSREKQLIRNYFISIDQMLAKGGDVSVVVKDITHWRAGAAVAKGAEVTTDAAGKAIPATAGNFIMGIALEAATAADDIISVQIVKAGYKA